MYNNCTSKLLTELCFEFENRTLRDLLSAPTLQLRLFQFQFFRVVRKVFVAHLELHLNTALLVILDVSSHGVQLSILYTQSNDSFTALI